MDILACLCIGICCGMLISYTVELFYIRKELKELEKKEN